MILVFISFIGACGFFGNVVEEWETSNGVIKIRVQKRTDIKLRYQYIFQATPTNLNDWHKIFVHVQDDPDPIPRNQVRFVGDKIGYLFMGNILATTTNGGKDWAIFSVEKDTEFGRKNPNLSWIQDVEIATDGSGSLSLRRYEGRAEPPAYYTSDYGQRWTIKNK